MDFHTAILPFGVSLPGAFLSQQSRSGSCMDEIPAADKDIDVVMASQTDLADVVHTLKQVVCIKG